MPRLRRSHTAERNPPRGAVPRMRGEERIEVKGVIALAAPFYSAVCLLFCFPFLVGCGMLYLIYFLIYHSLL